jgi:hypothetical protein
MPNNFSVPLTGLVHENLSIVMCFAYSQKRLAEMRNRKFAGGWEYLDIALFEISAVRAEKAFLELALFLRIIDDEEKISDYYAGTKVVPNCGKLFSRDGSEKTLTFRDAANKVIHSSGLEWSVFEDSEPILICHGRQEENWLRAEIDLVGFASVCGGLMS